MDTRPDGWEPATRRRGQSVGCPRRAHATRSAPRRNIPRRPCAPRRSPPRSREARIADLPDVRHRVRALERLDVLALGLRSEARADHVACGITSTPDAIESVDPMSPLTPLDLGGRGWCADCATSCPAVLPPGFSEASPALERVGAGPETPGVQDRRPPRSALHPVSKRLAT
jgi:hypothetical protein